MKNQHAFPVLLLVLLLPLLAACASEPEESTPPPAGPDRSTLLLRMQPDDVPVPPGLFFLTEDNSSYTYLGEGVRRVRLVYEGPTAAEKVLDFYRRTMPLAAYGWEPQSEEARPEGRLLRFVKGSEVCTVLVSLSGGNRTRSEVSIGAGS